MNDTQHTPQSDIEVMAQQFVDCFEPSAYELDKRFGWMDESEREELGKLAQKKLQEAFIETYSGMYGGK